MEHSIDREKVIEGLEWILEDDRFGFGVNWSTNCEPKSEEEQAGINIQNAIELLNEQEKLVDVDVLREKLGMAKDCEKCKQNTRACQYDSHFSLMDFCERLDIAIEELTEGR